MFSQTAGHGTLDFSLQKNVPPLALLFVKRLTS